MIITTSTLTALCSKLAALSSNQAGLGTDDFLAMSNMVMPALCGELMAAREEYLVYEQIIPCAVGTSTVRVPYRALNGTIRHLWWEDLTGQRTRLGALAIEDMEDYDSGARGAVSGFYLMGNSIMLLPTSDAAGSLVVAYPFRPNLLVAQTTCQQISGIAGNVVSLTSTPTNFVSGAYDIIDHLSGNGIVGFDLVASPTASNTMTFAALPAGVAVGNWLAQAGQSAVPMLPEEAHPLLLETTVLRLEMARGNQARMKASQALVADARKAWDALLLNRVVSKAKPAGNGGAQFPNRPS